MPFSFLNAAILAGLAAAALPILIHLFSRRKVTKVPFSSLQFLEQISRQRIKRLRMTQWIILALRTLAVALLALALSRPAIKGDSPLGTSRGESAVAVVIDGSLSMRAMGERESMWDRAQQRFQEVMDALEESDRVFILGTDPSGSSANAFSDPSSAWDFQRVQPPGYAGTDLAGAISRGVQTLSQTSALNKELFVISDFQRSGLSEEDAAAIAIDENVRTFLLPVREETLPNTGLSRGQLSGEGVNPTASILLTRYGNIPAEGLVLTAEAPGEVMGEQRITVHAQEPVSVDLPLKRMPTGSEDLTLRIPRDRLEADDVFYLSAHGMGVRKTLLIQEPASPSPYLPLALSPRSQGRYDVRVVAPVELQSVDFTLYDIVALDNVSTLGRGTLNRLRRWKEAGGVVFLAMGDRVDLRFYNQDILPALMPGVQLGNLRRVGEATGASYSLIPRAQGHHSFRGFEAQVDEPLTGASFWQIVEVQTSGDVRTLAEFGPGLPALVEGSGSLLLATSTDNKWNNLPTHAAFLPLLHQSLEAVAEKQVGGEVFVGEPITHVVDRSTLGTGEMICEGPGGAFLDVHADPHPRGMQLRTDPTELPGFYTIRSGGRLVTRRAVNTSPEESDLSTLSSQELADWFPGDNVRRLSLATPLRVSIREARYGREFWKELVAAVLLILVVEGWLSRRGVS